MCSLHHAPPRPAQPAVVILLATVLGSWVSTAMSADVWVVTDRLHPVHPVASARVIELDAPIRIMATLSQGLPVDPQKATAEVHERLRNSTISAQLAASYQEIIDAWHAGIAKIPAVLVDQRYVVYGDADVAHAVARIQAYRETHP